MTGGLELRGVGKRFGGAPVLAEIDLVVPPGAPTAVVGPSGSGKTTLLRLIAGFEAPDEGAIRLDGTLLADPVAGIPAHRRDIGLVMQEGALFPHMTVIDNIRFGIPRGAGDGPARAVALMDVVGLDRDMALRAPHQLSGGQQQRVALARALARRPRLMLLDEPFSALDSGLRDDMRRATARILTDAGIAAILVTHDKDEAMEFATQLVVLRGGRLVQSGPPRELYFGPADESAAAFLGDAIILDAQVNGGIATCPLGRVPLRAAAAMAEGPARILLRPAQIVLRPPGAAEGALLRVLHVEEIGDTARITLGAESAAGPSQVTFRIPARHLPPAGSRVSVALAGEAHRFRDRGTA